MFMLIAKPVEVRSISMKLLTIKYARLYSIRTSQQYFTKYDMLVCKQLNCYNTLVQQCEYRFLAEKI